MRDVRKLLLVIACLLCIGIPATAQQTAPSPALDAAVYIPPISLPPAVRLEGLRPVYQQLNRCASAALTIQLSYFGWAGRYDDSIRGLNPHLEDVAVRLDEMVRFAEEQGYLAIARVGGTLELVKALVAAGFPVLVETVYYDGADAFRDWMSHNRVIMGYDDAQGALLTFDSLLGNGENNTGRPWLYQDVDRRWRDLNRAYMVIYQPEQEEALRAVMGPLWDERAAAEQAIAQAQAELDSPYADSFSAVNMGAALVMLERYEEAAQYYDRARRAGLPWRYLWYNYEVFEAYYHTGRYQDMLELARSVIAGTPGVEEMYYYAGLAYESTGELQRAKNNYEVAVMRNTRYRDAITALGRVTVRLSGG